MISAADPLKLKAKHQIAAMGRVQRSGRGQEVEVEEARWAVEKACERVEKGDLEGALWLLERAERMHPSTRGLAEIQAVAQVCHAATLNPCTCSASQQTSSPQWYRILKVSEKADLSAIKKRYRQLALLLHPDKNKHARAEEAFKLVSEAYAHLSDKKKRDTFDLSIQKWECRKCSFESQSSWEATKCSRESLKGKNQTDFQSRFFHFDFHSAEWKMEHEKLRMFRERAQAKVDSLAHILKQRRSRWNEEMGTTKGRCKQAGDDCSISKRDYRPDVLNRRWQDVEKRPLNSQSLKGLHQRKLRGSFINSDQKKPSQILKDGVEETLLQELKSRTSRERETPQVLQNLNGLLEILKEEMSGNSANIQGEDAKSRDCNQCEDNRAARGNVATCQGHSFWLKYSSENKPQCRNKIEEEFTVIDDFLAGLNEGALEHERPLSGVTGSGFRRAEGTSSSTETSMKKIGRASYLSAKSPKKNGADSCNGTLEELTTALFQEKYAQNCPVKPLERKKSVASLEADNGVLKPFCSHDEAGIGVLKENRSWKKSKVPVNDSVHWSIAYGTSSDDENILQSQKKKSEQLLRTLERLREETKSVAATLESIKEARLFPGSCHVPLPAASIMAT